MVRDKFKAKFLVGVILGAFLSASPAAAFFVGNIEVTSKFGEKFEASFEIHLDNNEVYEVALGEVGDYEKLGLIRPSLVDSLELEKPIAATGKEKVIRVYSKIPLFFPSFNLVVIAKHNDGTLLENFLVTVDFQKGLALNGLGKKKKKSATPSVKPQTAKKENPNKENKVSPPIQDKGSGQDKGLPERKTVKLPQKFEVDKVSPNKTFGINPTPVVNRLQNRRRLSGAIWAVPKTVFPVTGQVLQNIASPSSGEEVEKQKDPVVSQSGDTVQLEKGEGLFSVARKIKINEIHPARIAVALWMRNIDKFIYGNIHGIQAGTQLEKGGIEKLVAKVDLQTAKNILSSQAQEWKLTKEKANTVEEIEQGIQEVPLPVERIDDIASIFDWIAGWKTSWEENDIGKHISFYHENLAANSTQSTAQESSVRKRKKNLFLKYPNPSLNLSSQNLISKQGGSWIVFEQHFFSKSLESFGTKEVRVARTNGNWKIDEEKFYAEKNKLTDSIRREKEKLKKGRPFVIHVSSHSKETEAFSASNKLRKNGYDAYTAPVRISKGIKIYRVYIGRFATWEQAHRVVMVLRGKKLGGHATAIPYPFTLQVGQANSIVEARQLLEKLRVIGVSGFLSIFNGGSEEGLKFGVYVGAFKKPENAVWLMQRLKEAGFSFKRIRP